VALRTVHSLLADRASTTADACFVRFATGDLTFAEVDEESSAVAAGLASLGVGRGDLVPLWMPNSPNFIVAWMAISKVGAVATFINTAMRGPALTHAINLSNADVAIIDDSLRHLIEPIATELKPITFLSIDALRRSNTAFEPAACDELDPAVVMYTSGTTGRSKGCVLSHRYVVRNAELMGDPAIPHRVARREWFTGDR